MVQSTMVTTMDGASKSVMAAALSLYAEQLAKDKAAEELSYQQAKGKGKGRARDEDVELERVREEELRICRELGSQILGEAGDIDGDGDGSGGVMLGTKDKRKGKDVVRNYSRPRGSEKEEEKEFVREDELQPYVNPFTGLPVVPETGFEAGPSWREPPPLRVPIKTASVELDQSFGKHGKGHGLDSPAVGVPKEPKQNGVERTKSVSKKPAAARIDEWQSERKRGSDAPTSLSEWKGSTPPLPWNEYRPAKASGSKNKWLNGFTDLGSKALKVVTGTHNQPTIRSRYFSSREPLEDIQSEPPMYDFMPTQTESESKALKAVNGTRRFKPRDSFDDTGETVLMKPPSYDSMPEHTLASVPASQPLQRKPSQDTLPPAYDAISTISRRSSTTSVSPAGQSSVARSPSLISRIDRLSPNNTGGSLTSGGKGAETWKRLSKEGPSRLSIAEQKINSRSPISFRDMSYEGIRNSDVSGMGSSDTVKKGSLLPTKSSKRRSGGSGRRVAESEDSFSTSSGPAANSGRPGRKTSRTATTPPKRRRSDFGTPPRKTPSPPLFPPVSEDPFTTPGANNPWNDHLSTDEALAKSLQQEEYRELKMERDMLLALSLENGTAEASDIELANYMAREMEALLASPGPIHHSTTPHKTTRYSPGISSLTSGLSQLDLDILAAQSLDRELNSDSSTDANLAAALHMQAAFDAEAESEEAWEEWKKYNVEECVICGDEHGKDMLVRPCDHGYCGGCLKEGFEGALKAKTPLKCCDKVIDIVKCEGLDTTFVRTYKEMAIELTAQNPTYCHARKCGTFLPPRMFIGDVGTCEKCKAKTCKHCRQKIHPGRFCEEDQETKAVKELGRVKGWKTCPGCNHLIERQDGCLHMVCTRCQTAFCYRCSKKWKDCESTCPDAISATHPKI